MKAFGPTQMGVIQEIIKGGGAINCNSLHPGFELAAAWRLVNRGVLKHHYYTDSEEYKQAPLTPAEQRRLQNAVANHPRAFSFFVLTDEGARLFESLNKTRSAASYKPPKRRVK
jgi:hypothetical protein